MGFFDFFQGKKEKSYIVEQAAPLLTALLEKTGFSMENPDLMLAWTAFKEFCIEYRFKCNDDAVLWEIGPYGHDRTFQWHLVRQFDCGTGDDDALWQLCFDLDFPTGVGEGLAMNLWSYDFDGDFQRFFATVERHPNFLNFVGTVPISAAVMLDHV